MRWNRSKKLISILNRHAILAIDTPEALNQIAEVFAWDRRKMRGVICDHTPTIAEDSQQPEWCQGELDKLIDALEDSDIYKD